MECEAQGEAPNTSFSQILPNFQLAVDSTSLGEFKTCPRKYYYSIIQGWRPLRLSADLEFGILMHSGTEVYHKARAGGASHDEALAGVLRMVLVETWDHELGRPKTWGTPEKNRATLLRSLVWYLDHYHAEGGDPAETVCDLEGRPAVELSFRFASGYVASTGEEVLLCGHLDRVVNLAGDYYISDVKTTTSQLGEFYSQKFTPDNQFSLYSIAGRLAFGFQTKGVLLDALQVGVGFTRFQRFLIPRPAASQDEWLEDTHGWLRQMEEAALREHWPQNDKACGMYASKTNPGGCQFREVCSKAPADREKWLKQGFGKRVWDPLVPR